MKKTALGFLICLATVLVVSAQATDMQDVQKERSMRFKASSTAIKAMFRQHLPAGDFATISKEAGILNIWAKEMPAKFPAGSDSPDDQARPEIWTDFETFKAAAAQYDKTTAALQKAADGGDAEIVQAALSDVTASCKACHQKFRKK